MRSTLLSGMQMGILVGALVGCVRFVAPPAGEGPPAAARQGDACSEDSGCASGFCTNAVCCDVRCDDPQEACHLPGSLGTCRMKTAGAACSEVSHCPSDAPNCGADQVCCETPCDEACHSCNNPGAAGLCLPVADNTDPARECDGVCTSCQGGSCGATLPGIDPDGDCATHSACNGFGACAVDLGQPCSEAQRCANGACVLGVCRTVQVEEFELLIPYVGISDFRVTSLDTGPEGRSVVGVTTQYGRTTASTGEIVYEPGPVMAGVEVSSVAWRSPLVSACAMPEDWLSATRVGPMSMVMLAQQEDIFPSPPCGRTEGAFEAILVSPTGELLDRQKLPGVTPQSNIEAPVAVAVASNNVLMAALVVGGGSLKLATRPVASAEWEMEDVGDGAGSWGMVSMLELGGVPAILDFAESDPQLRLQVRRGPGDWEVTRVPFPGDCLVLDELSAAVLPQSNSLRALAVFACDTGETVTLHPPGVAVVDISLPVAERISPPGYLTFTSIPDGANARTKNAFSASPGALEDGTPALLYSDALENVWWAYREMDGRWGTIPIQLLGYSGIGQRVRNVVAQRGRRGLVVAWTQQYRFDDPSGTYQQVSAAKLVRAVITP